MAWATSCPLVRSLRLRRSRTVHDAFRALRWRNCRDRGPWHPGRGPLHLRCFALVRPPPLQSLIRVDQRSQASVRWLQVSGCSPFQVQPQDELSFGSGSAAIAALRLPALVRPGLLRWLVGSGSRLVDRLGRWFWVCGVFLVRSLTPRRSQSIGIQVQGPFRVECPRPVQAWLQLQVGVQWFRLPSPALVPVLALVWPHQLLRI